MNILQKHFARQAMLRRLYIIVEQVMDWPFSSLLLTRVFRIL